MTAIPGIQLKKNAQGEIINIDINLQEHPEIVPLLKEKGLIPKTDFEIEAEQALPVNEVRNRIHKKIEAFYANRRNQPTDRAEN